MFAVADGLGMGFSDSDEPDFERELTIRMPRDDAPLAGRLVDLEGRPVAGATVRVRGDRRAAWRRPDALSGCGARLEGENLRAQGEVPSQGCRAHRSALRSSHQ